MYAKSVHKTELSNLTKNEIVLRPKHGGGGGVYRDPKFVLRNKWTAPY